MVARGLTALRTWRLVGPARAVERWRIHVLSAHDAERAREGIDAHGHREAVERSAAGTLKVSRRVGCRQVLSSAASAGADPRGCRRGGRRGRTGIRTHGAIVRTREDRRVVTAGTSPGGPPHASSTPAWAGGAGCDAPDPRSRATGRFGGPGELQRCLAGAGLADSGSDEARHPVAPRFVWCSATTSAGLELIGPKTGFFAPCSVAAPGLGGRAGARCTRQGRW
jgi:hypothetical protein